MAEKPCSLCRALGEEGRANGHTGQQAGVLGSNLGSVLHSGWVTVGKSPPFSMDLSFSTCSHEGPIRAVKNHGKAEHMPWLRGQLPLSSSCGLLRMWAQCY